MRLSTGTLQDAEPSDVKPAVDRLVRMAPGGLGLALGQNRSEP